MSKKENPNLLFRKEWWDFIRWESDVTIGKTIRLLCEDYFGYAQFNVEQFSAANAPQMHERLAIPMIKSASEEKETYIQKCGKLSANARQKATKAAIDSNCLQLQTNAENCEQLRGNTIQYNTIHSNSFFSGARTRVETPPEKEKEKKEILLSLALFFVSKGVLQPYTTAEKAWNYNESQDWKFTNRNGSIKDCSKNKLAFLKGWDCEGLQYPLSEGEFFRDFCTTVQMLPPEILDDFHGCRPDGEAFYFLFNRKRTADLFNTAFSSNPDLCDKAGNFILSHYPQCTRGYKAIIYKKE